MGIFSCSASAVASTSSPRIIVIGAGVSGLSCARDLVKAGHSVLVLEARNRIGGRAHTDTEALNGTPMDLGGSFIHGLAGNPLYKIAKERGLKTYRAGSEDQQTSNIYSPEGPPLPHEMSERLGFNSLYTIFSSSATYAQDRSDALPSPYQSLSDYVLDEEKSSLFRGLKNDTERKYARAMSESWDGWMGAELKDVSLRYWQSDVTYGGPDATIVDGYRGVYEHLAAEARKDKDSKILLEKEVTSLELAEDGDTIEVKTRSTSPSAGIGSEEACKAPFVVCTLPLGVLQKRPPKFSPALPKRRLDATARLGMGLLNKIIITYSTCFWPEKQTFITLLPSPASEELLPMLKDRALFAQNYKPITGKNTLVFYCGATFGEEVEKLSDEKVKIGMHKILMHHFGDQPNFPEDGPEGVIVTRWQADPYSCGAYSYVKPSTQNQGEVGTPYDFNELARPLWGDRLFFAGEATDSDHYATVHGPLITGQREAKRILDKMEQEEMED